ncbi:MAG: alpha-1,4 polygalactosaminidase [Dehalococcoidia bacterium]|nr:alpha-1,4 polygalactosaminidase [Dehalococcoidia bacterium]
MTSLQQGDEVVLANEPLPPGALWAPIVGEETQGLLAHLSLDAESAARLTEESVRVISKAVSPTARSQASTGLIVGYVQSGKTMSMTAVSALARDNAFRLVIILGGVSTILLGQNTNRFERDLRIASRPDRPWAPFSNPRPVQHRHTIRDILDQWRQPVIPGLEPQTLFLTVMKQGTHLDNLIATLTGLDLSDVPTLIIDDEADQAGLNTRVNQNEVSATYARLLRLRDLIPHHTYLEYTATPQAPLLINIIDRLSPQFAEVITPGDDYTGVAEFFINRPELVRVIPPGDIGTPAQPLSGPPASLHEAMQLFFLGVSAGVVLDHALGNRSMMVHPDRRTNEHAQYFGWVQAARGLWAELLSRPSQDPDRRDLVLDFERRYDDLTSSVPNLPDFGDLMTVLPRAIAMTQVSEVNAARGQTPQVPWHNAYSHILVGGQAMDRGFTVEGLTVTYMPRGLGVGNADTIQQRARFLGYKRSIIGYARVYLESGVRDAYRAYADHEEDVRQRLIEHRDNGGTLSEWKRKMVLDMAIRRPTRANVIDVPYRRDDFAAKWFDPKAPHLPSQALAENRATVARFVANHLWSLDAGHPQRTDEQKHLQSESVLLRDVYDELLSQLRHSDVDSEEFTALLVQLELYLRSHVDARCVVFRMSGGASRTRSTRDGRILNLFQGRNPLRGSVIYPGDREIREDDHVSVQIHTLLLRDDNGQELERDVPGVAVWLPPSASIDVLVQAQGAS